MDVDTGKRKAAKRVVLVGVGFGGLHAARTLTGHGLLVQLLDLQDHHLFTPLLYQVATAALPAEAVAIPVRDIIRHWPDVEFEQVEVRSIDLEARRVLTVRGEVPYDYLILTAGAVRNYFGKEDVRAQAYDLKKLRQAQLLCQHIAEVCQDAAQEHDTAKQAALLSFVIVGGGPTGVEFAAALAEWLRRGLSRDYPRLRRARPQILVLEAAGQLLPAFPPRLQRYAHRRLRQLGVEVRFGAVVSGAGPGVIRLQDGATIAAHTLVWAAGVRAAPVAESLPGAHTRAGRVPVGPDLTLDGHPEVYVIGDLAYIQQDAAALPMTAPVAAQEGRYVAQAILDREQGRSVAPFRYRDAGAMAVLGHFHAVAAFRGWIFTGRTGWLVWLVLHLAYLVGFRNPIRALWGWGSTYLGAKQSLLHR